MTAMNLNRAIRGPVTAVPVVAGKGVRIVPDVENNRFVVEADETVLYEDSDGLGVNSCTLSEVPSNFEWLEFTVGFHGGDNGCMSNKFPGNSTYLHFIYGAGNGSSDYLMRVYATISGTSVTVSKSKTMYQQYTSTASDTIRNNNANDMACIFKVIGINRIASN